MDINIKSVMSGSIARTMSHTPGPKTVSNKEPKWAPKPKMGSKRSKISLQQSNYMGNLFWVT